MKVVKKQLLSEAPLRIGVRFVLSGGYIERVVLDPALSLWEAVSYEDDDHQVEEFSDRFLLPWCEGWRQGKSLFLPLKEGDEEAALRKGLEGVGCGITISYSEFAKRLSSSPRAAGRMLGRNRFPLVIPCHRVICKDGSLGGYLGGVDVKRHLLEEESCFLGKHH